MIQHMKISQYNPFSIQTERKENHMIISLSTEKVFDKIQYLLMMKVLERSDIQGT